MITVDIPRSPEDAEFLINCACDYAQEALRGTGLLHNGSLLSEDMLTLVIHKGRRRVGAVSSVTGINHEDGSRRTEIDVRYFVPRWRGKGYTRPLFEALLDISPLPLFLRGPVHPSSIKTAEELGIGYYTGEAPDMKMITDLVIGSTPCVHPEDGPCPTCVRDELRKHFTGQCAKMTVKAHAYQGISA